MYSRKNDDDYKDFELMAFLSVFHPERGDKANRQLVRESRRDKQRERDSE